MRSCFSVSTWDPAVVVSASSHNLSVHCTVKYNYEPVAYYELPEVITLFIGDEIKKTIALSIRARSWTRNTAAMAYEKLHIKYQVCIFKQ